MTWNTGLADLAHSERGVWCFIVLIVITILVIFRLVDVPTWLSFVKYLTMIVVASKTVTTAVETAALKKPQIAREPKEPQQEQPT